MSFLMDLNKRIFGGDWGNNLFSGPFFNLFRYTIVGEKKTRLRI